jgi:NAD(P)-dependent dehydrogenase (short-subunit alcohol dehydrogenase family)
MASDSVMSNRQAGAGLPNDRSLSRGPVVVLGASTGVGWATALRLQQMGYAVLATVRRDDDAARLREQGVTPFALDVTAAADIKALHAQLEGQPLAGVVNNAGVGTLSPLEHMNAVELRHQFEVNVIGHMSVIQAVLPGLRAGAGRIITVGSPAGRLASPLNGAYGATKAALTLMNDTWRRELAPQGIKVVLIEPGAIKTPFLSKNIETLEKAIDEGSPELRSYYGAQIEAMLTSMRKMYGSFASEPDAIAKVIARALTASKPRNCYRVGLDARAMIALATLLPGRLLDVIFRQSVSQKSPDVQQK